MGRGRLRRATGWAAGPFRLRAAKAKVDDVFLDGSKFWIHARRMVEGTYSAARWHTDQRRAFIEHRLFWRERIGLTDLMETFGLSRSQASTDLNSYIKEFPNHLNYDKTARTYVPGAEFSVHYADIDGSEHLSKLLAMRDGAPVVRSDWESFVPDIRAAALPLRTVRADIVRDVLKAIEIRRQLQVVYQSMSASDAADQIIEPHAVAHDGFRWHCRAFCLRDGVFKDFVLARVVASHLGQKAGSDPRDDADWNSFLVLKIAPHPDLSPSQRRIIELDYGMDGGVAEVPVRRSMLYYTLRRLGLDVDPKARRPEDQQIILVGQSDPAVADHSISKGSHEGV